MLWESAGASWCAAGGRAQPALRGCASGALLAACLHLISQEAKQVELPSAALLWCVQSWLPPCPSGSRGTAGVGFLFLCNYKHNIARLHQLNVNSIKDSLGFASDRYTPGLWSSDGHTLGASICVQAGTSDSLRVLPAPHGKSSAGDTGKLLWKKLSCGPQSLCSAHYRLGGAEGWKAKGRPWHRKKPY